MSRIFPSLLLTALLLAPVAALAQTLPPAAKAAPQAIILQVAFFSIAVSDVDALGINFNLLPLSRPHTFLTFATGNIVSQLYQTLMRTRGRAFVADPITAFNNTPVTTRVDTEVFAPSSVPSVNSSLLFPQLIGSVRIRGTLTLVPHIRPDNKVILSIISLNKRNEQVQLPAVPGGQQIVFLASLNEGQKGSDRPQDRPSIEGLSGHMTTLPASQELLIFITPMISEAVENPANLQQ